MSGKGVMDIIKCSSDKRFRRVLAAGCLAALMLFALSCDRGKDKLYEGEREIAVNPTTPIHGKSKETVNGLRAGLVNMHSDLGIYPKDYTLSRVVFGQVTWGDDWVNDVQIYVNNPYLLVMTGAAGKVNPLLAFCRVESVTYKTGRIDVLYRGEQASKWFDYIYDYYPDNDDMARLNFVNALDAGFRYAHVDIAKSLNVDTSRPVQPGAVVGRVFRIFEFFHVGRYKKNNKSPYDENAWVRFNQRNADTIIYIKLWREWPPGPEAEEDLAYVIEIRI
jgi:hypothetical protein